MTTRHAIVRGSLLGLTVLALLIRLSFFSVSVTHLQPSADESITVLQAREILHGKLPLLFMSQPYLFPLESYLAAPFSAFLPSTALGARAVPFVLNLLAVAVAALLLTRVFRHRLPWAGLLLILVPSSYVLILQAAYGLPGYSSLPLFGGLCLWWAVGQRALHGRRAWAMAALTGFAGGLVFTSHMLALPFLFAVGAFMCLGTNWRSAVRNTTAFIPGVIVGVSPLLLSKWLLPGSYAAVSQSFPMRETIERLWSPALKYTLSTALGLRTCVFPDNDSSALVPIPLTLAGTAWAILLGRVLLWRLIAGVRKMVRRRWPALDPRDMFIIIAMLTLVAFALNKRADSRSYRYLLPLLWAFPFVVQSVISRIHLRTPRVLLYGIVGALVAWNGLGTGVVMGRWCDPLFPEREAGIADIKPVLHKLGDLNIRNVVASYGVAYRLNFQSGGKILAAQPMNERFPGWPVAYKAEVDAATNVAYVLTDTVRFLKPDIFDRHLRTMHVGAERIDMKQADVPVTIGGTTSVGTGESPWRKQVSVTAGTIRPRDATAKQPETGHPKTTVPFVLYHSFRFLPPRDKEQPVVVSADRVTASHNAADTANLVDGSDSTVWTTHEPQQTSMWVQVDFGDRMPVSGIRLAYGRYFHDHASRMDLVVSTEDQWVPLQTDIRPELDKFEFRNGHPVYGGPDTQTLRFDPHTIHGFRLVVTDPNSSFSWTLADIEVLRQP